MPPKKRAISLIAGKAASAPTPAKKPAKPRKRVQKPKKEEEAVVENDENAAPDDSSLPGPSSALSKDKEEIKVVSRPTQLKELPSDAVKCAYPFENLDLLSTLEGTVQAVQKAVTNILDDHVVRCTIPIEKMTEICQTAEKNLSSRRLVDRTNGNLPLLDAQLEDVLEATIETDFNINKSVFRQELTKYILIASAYFDKLSTGTLLSVVRDLGKSGLNLTEFENGYPAKVASKCHKYFGLTPTEFRSQNSQMQLKMNKTYCESALRFHLDVENYLDEKHKQLKSGGWKNDAEGKKKERQLAIAFQKNRCMGRHIKTEYEDLVNEEEVEVNPLLADYRSVMLSGKIGVRTKEEESTLNRDFAKTPSNILKAFSDQWRLAKGEKILDDAITLDVGSGIPFIPTPLVHRAHLI